MDVKQTVVFAKIEFEYLRKSILIAGFGNFGLRFQTQEAELNHDGLNGNASKSRELMIETLMEVMQPVVMAKIKLEYLRK